MFAIPALLAVLFHLLAVQAVKLTLPWKNSPLTQPLLDHAENSLENDDNEPVASRQEQVVLQPSKMDWKSGYFDVLQSQDLSMEKKHRQIFQVLSTAASTLNATNADYYWVRFAILDWARLQETIQWSVPDALGVLGPMKDPMPWSILYTVSEVEEAIYPGLTADEIRQVWATNYDTFFNLLKGNVGAYKLVASKGMLPNVKDQLWRAKYLEDSHLVTLLQGVPFKKSFQDLRYSVSSIGSVEHYDLMRPPHPRFGKFVREPDAERWQKIGRWTKHLWNALVTHPDRLTAEQLHVHAHSLLVMVHMFHVARMRLFPPFNSFAERHMRTMMKTYPFIFNAKGIAEYPPKRPFKEVILEGATTVSVGTGVVLSVVVMVVTYPIRRFFGFD